ncbi:MAG: hypothetical protein RL637_333 [Pseudomonadota bacterium]|jgi:hypothetical protein
MRQGIAELENQHLEIVNWLLEREGNPNAEINFKRVVKLIAEHNEKYANLKLMFKSLTEDFEQKEKYYKKQLHSIKKAETLGQAKLIATETLL